MQLIGSDKSGSSGVPSDDDDVYEPPEPKLVVDKSSAADDDSQSDASLDQTADKEGFHDVGRQNTSETLSYSSKGGYLWYKLETNQYTQFRNRISFSGNHGPTSFAKNHVDESCVSAFELIFDKSIQRSIVDFTNKEAATRGSGIKLESSDVLLFVAVILCRSVFCSGVAVSQLWNRNYGLPIIS